MIIRLILLLLLVPVYSFSGDHPHFDVEKVKAGVLAYAAYRDQVSIDAAFSSTNTDEFGAPLHPPGSTYAGYYNSTIDGCAMHLHNAGPTQQTLTGTDFAATGGEIWTQVEIRFEQAFLDEVWDNDADVNSKIWRVYCVGTAGNCNIADERMLTTYWKNLDYWENEDYSWWSSVIFKWDGDEHWRPPDVEWGATGDIWQRWTEKIDITNSTYSLWVTNVSTGATTQIITDLAASWNSAVTIDSVAPLLHWSGASVPDDASYDFEIGYRNVIVSSTEIELNAVTAEGSRITISGGVVK